MARRRRSREFEASTRPSVREYPSVIANRVRLDLGPRTLTALAQLEGLRRQMAEHLEQLNRDRVAIDDRRRFDPEGKLAPRLDRSGRRAHVMAASLLGSSQRFVDPSQMDPFFAPGSRGFKRMAELYDPEHSPEHRSKIMECIRRKLRREVLFAKGVGGSKRVKRSRRRTEWSDVNC